MTPQKKAQHIYDEMKGFRVTNKHRKKCAKVAAKIASDVSHLGGSYTDDQAPQQVWCYYHQYWEEVLTEIEKL